jgi:hypothetical protein
MQRLIDCTYLHGVARCLRGEAVHFDDLTNFLRLIGEMLLADRLLFTADPTGPVYKPSIEAASMFADLVGDKSFLQHFDIKWVDYMAACQRAATDITVDLKKLPLPSPSVGPISPSFENSTKDPDGLFLHDLRAMISSKQSAQSDPVLHPANAARFVLTRPDVINSLRRTNFLSAFSKEKDFVRLTAVVRTIIYRHIGLQLKSTYLPASSRAQLLPAFHRIGEDEITALFEAAYNERISKVTSASFSLTSAVDALVRSSRGDPKEILLNAWKARGVILPLRNVLAPAVQGDALGVSFKQHAQIRKLSKEFGEIINGNDGPHLIDCIQIQFVLFAIPSLTLYPGRFREWFTRKRSFQRVGRFAELIQRANNLKAIPAYKTLIQQVGLKKWKNETS